jgi:hypothetical protein
MASLIADEIDFYGCVTFANLKESNGKTTINGGNITTGTISGVTLQSITGSTSVRISNGRVAVFKGGSGSNPGSLAGGLRFDVDNNVPSWEAKERLFLYTNPGTALKIQSFGANMSIEAAGADNYVYAMGNWSFFDANVTAPKGGW